MEHYYSFNIHTLATKAAYFKHYLKCEFPNANSIILFPGVTTTSQCILFLQIIQHSNNVLQQLLQNMSLKCIFILADYFGVDQVFEEIQTKYFYDFTLGPAILKYFIQYYSNDHPQTISFLQNFSTIFLIPNHIKHSPEMLLNTQQLKKSIRSIQRKNSFISQLRILKCELCRSKIIRTIKTANMEPILAPCCMSPVHSKCFNQLLTKSQHIIRCTLCGTKFELGVPFPYREHRSVTLEREIRRSKFKSLLNM